MTKISNWKTFCFRLKHRIWRNEIIRKKEKSNGDFSFTEDRCHLIGITTEGKLSIIQTSWSGRENYFELEQSWNDGLWQSTQKLERSKLKWKKFLNKKIKANPYMVQDHSFSDDKCFDFPVLVSASQHHLVLNWNKHEHILDYRWVNPKIWESI